MEKGFFKSALIYSIVLIIISIILYFILQKYYFSILGLIIFAVIAYFSAYLFGTKRILNDKYRLLVSALYFSIIIVAFLIYVTYDYLRIINSINYFTHTKLPYPLLNYLKDNYSYHYLYLLFLLASTAIIYFINPGFITKERLKLKNESKSSNKDNNK